MIYFKLRIEEAFFVSELHPDDSVAQILTDYYILEVQIYIELPHKVTYVQLLPSSDHCLAFR